MVKILKIRQAVYEDVDVKIIDTNGNEVDNPLLPQNIEALRAVVLDTLAWMVGDEIKKATGDYVKMSAANSKAVALIAKLVAPLVDTSKLTDAEKSAFDKTVALGESGYSDSKLLNASLDAVTSTLQAYAAKIDAATKAKTREELIAILEEEK